VPHIVDRAARPPWRLHSAVNVSQRLQSPHRPMTTVVDEYQRNVADGFPALTEPVRLRDAGVRRRTVRPASIVEPQARWALTAGAP